MLKLKPIIALLLFTVVAVIGIGCDKEKPQVTEVERIIERVVSPEINLDDYPHAKAELAEHIKNCGPGVVIPAECECDCEHCKNGVCDPDKCDCEDCECCKPRGENRCSYRVKVDDLLLENPVVNTGLHHDPLWHLKNGVIWVDPEESTPLMKNDQIPDKWNFLDQGVASQVPVNRQTCGDCWSQATTKALELMIAARDKKVVNLSVQTQISRCSNHGSCGGGYMTAPDFLVKYGNPFEHQDPYQGRNSSCRFSQAELNAGFEYKLESAPYVGRSLDYSRFHRNAVRHPKMEAIQAAMMKYDSPAVVTIAAINHSGGIINSCSALNSVGNHMQDIVGWYPHPQSGETVAMVWNSWGRSHGQNGITHMRWSCPGGLNRGLGVSARVYVYKPKCSNQPEPFTGPDVDFVKTSPGNGVMIGKDAKPGQTCEWTPSEGLTFFTADKCKAWASPDKSTEYHVKATTECGSASAMVLVRPLMPVWSLTGRKEMPVSGNIVLTPFGEVEL